MNESGDFLSYNGKYSTTVQLLLSYWSSIDYISGGSSATVRVHRNVATGCVSSSSSSMKIAITSGAERFHHRLPGHSLFARDDLHPSNRRRTAFQGSKHGIYGTLQQDHLHHIWHLEWSCQMLCSKRSETCCSPANTICYARFSAYFHTLSSADCRSILDGFTRLCCRQ